LRSRHQIAEDIRWGFSNGMLLTTILCGFMCIMALLRRSVYYSKYGITLWTILGLYLVSGCIGGCLVGLLRPFARSRIGAMFVGSIIMIPFYTMAMMTQAGPPAHWHHADILDISLCSILLGSTLGYIWWGRAHKSKEIDTSSRRPI
jgi:quinol-cytochrome oxidoreductase complex cytochrome b subunit